MLIGTRSIGGWMGLVALTAFSVAALRNCRAEWATAVLIIDIAGLGLGLVLFFQGPGRAFGAGFLVACGLALVVFEWPPLRDRLPSTPDLRWLHDHLVDMRTEQTRLPRSAFDESYSAWSAQHPGIVVAPLAIDNETFILAWVVPTQDIFKTIAHRLTALFLGLMGGSIARRLSLVSAVREARARVDGT